MGNSIKILETFRDSIQGLDYFIETDKKIKILQSLLNVGFDFLDIGSFVSPKVVPQFKDMKTVIERLDTDLAETKLFALVANESGANAAGHFEKIDILGYPFSTSETFLHKNIRSDFETSWRSMNTIQDVCVKRGKKMMVYLAMAFGNPYDDPVNIEICHSWTEKLQGIGINNIHLSDIIGVSTPRQIEEYYKVLSHDFPTVDFGIHLHLKAEHGLDKLEAAYDGGCKIFDGVISGLGGCPLTGYELVQNMPTTNIVDFASKHKICVNLDRNRMENAKIITEKLLIKS